MNHSQSLDTGFHTASDGVSLVERYSTLDDSSLAKTSQTQRGSGLVERYNRRSINVETKVDVTRPSTSSDALQKQVHAPALGRRVLGRV